jgi:hypothetical protein
MGANDDTTMQSEPLYIDTILIYFIITLFLTTVLTVCCKCLQRVIRSLPAVQPPSLPESHVKLDGPQPVPDTSNALLVLFVHDTEPSSTDLYVPVSHTVAPVQPDAC